MPVAVAVLLVGLSVILCWLMYSTYERSFYHATSQHTFDTMEIVRDLGIESVESQIKNVKSEVKTRASDNAPALRAAEDDAAIGAVLADIPATEYGLDCWYMTADGRLVGSDGAAAALEDIMPMVDGAAVLGDTDPQLFGPAHAPDGAYVMAAAAPVMVDGQVAGALIERIDGYCVSAWIEKLHFEAGEGVAYLIDNTGRNIAASREENYDWFEQEYNATELAKTGDSVAASVAALEQLPLQGETGLGSYEWEGGTSYAAYGLVEDMNWGFYFGFYGNELESYVERVMAEGGATAQVAIVLLIAVLGLIAVLSVRSLSRERAANEALIVQKERIEQQADALRASEARFGIALANTGNIVIDYDLDSNVIQCFTTPEDAKTCEATPANLRENLVTGREIEGDSLALFCEALDDLHEGAMRAECMLEASDDYEGKLWYRVSLSRLASRDGALPRAIGVLEDVTKEREADYDSLTGLLDRKTAFEASCAALAAADSEQRAALVMIDVDRFKSINDACGHMVGDEVLQRVACVLAERFGDDALVARYGGDEFSAFFRVAPTRAWFAETIEAINGTLAGEDGCSSEAHALTCSFGISIRRAAAVTFDQLQIEADRALYAAKRAGKSTHRFFDEA